MEQTLGLKIRKVREIKNFSQQYVADKLSVSQSTYSDIENGKTPISEEKLTLIANILDVSVDVIKEFNDQVVFNSCIQSGYINHNYIQPVEKIEQLYKDMLEIQEKRIADMLLVIESKDKLIALLEKNSG